MSKTKDGDGGKKEDKNDDDKDDYTFPIQTRYAWRSPWSKTWRQAATVQSDDINNSNGIDYIYFYLLTILIEY